jgi:hypothetical protein
MKIAVTLIEYERGWGSKAIHTEYFTDLDKAQAYADEVNSKNTATEVPDYYIIAETSIVR